MLTRDEAVGIAGKAVEGTFESHELARIDVELVDDRYIVTFVLIVPPLTVGSGFVQVTLDARTGEVLERLRDAD